MLQIDGSQGEGGGQVLRTCLSLAALTGRPFHIKNIRAGRRKPGLRPQHLTAVRAVAAICCADLTGADLNSTTLTFKPGVRPQAGEYEFDVSEAAQGGSAGSVTLIFQAILWPLLYANGSSEIRLDGGTHVPFSPPYHYLARVAGPAFARVGATFSVELRDWGWYPAGGGRMTATIHNISRLDGTPFEAQPINKVEGIAAVTNLPAHIPQRMANRANNLLADAGYSATIQAQREKGRGPGAGIVLWLPNGGFSALGRKGLAAEKVAEQAVDDLLTFAESGAAVDKYLADQLLLPLCLAHGRSTYSTRRLTRHTLTNIHLLRQWLGATIEVDGAPDWPAAIAIEGIGFQPG